jgi:hypothetical protein
MNQSSFVENAQGRHIDDYYKTPAAVTLALCDEFKLRRIEPRTILDVGCGDGAIGRVLRQTWEESEIHAVEASKERYFAAANDDVINGVGGARAMSYDQIWLRDWCNLPKWPIGEYAKESYELVVSNPPFKSALAFLKLALQRVRPGGHVAFLLISQWDQETVHDDERGRFLDSLRRPDGSEGYGKLRWKGRIDFRGDGRTDRVSHEWLIIGPGFEGSFVRVPRSPMEQPEQLTMGIG